MIVFVVTQVGCTKVGCRSAVNLNEEWFSTTKFSCCVYEPDSFVRTSDGVPFVAGCTLECSGVAWGYRATEE